MSVKAAVLIAYELVPVAYCQRFRSWEKSGRQTYMKLVYFTAEFHSYDALCALIVL